MRVPFSNTIHIATMRNTKRICEVLLVTQVVPITTYSILRPSAFFPLREYFYAVENVEWKRNEPPVIPANINKNINEYLHPELQLKD